MVYTASGVVTYGFPIDDFTFTYFVSGVALTDAAANALDGRAVTQDTAAAGTVKLTADGDPIFGRVYRGENRQIAGVVTASIQRKFKEKLPATVGHGIGLGDSVEGAAGGLVRAAAAPNDTLVIEVGTDYVVVEKL